MTGAAVQAVDVQAVDVLAVDVLAVSADAYAGPAGLVLVLLMFVATILLVRNMDKRVKKLPRDFPPPAQRDLGPVTRDAEPDPSPKD